MKDWRQLKSASVRCLYSDGDLQGAERLLREAIDAAAETAPLEVSVLLNSLSNLLAKATDYKGAELAARRSIEEERKHGPPIEESDRLGSYHSALSYALEMQGKYSEALTILDEAIRVFALHVGEEENLMSNLRRHRLELQENSWRG